MAVINKEIYLGGGMDEWLQQLLQAAYQGQGGQQQGPQQNLGGWMQNQQLGGLSQLPMQLNNAMASYNQGVQGNATRTNNTRQLDMGLDAQRELEAMRQGGQTQRLGMTLGSPLLQGLSGGYQQPTGFSTNYGAGVSFQGNPSQPYSSSRPLGGGVGSQSEPSGGQQNQVGGWPTGGAAASYGNDALSPPAAGGGAIGSGQTQQPMQRYANVRPSQRFGGRNANGAEYYGPGGAGFNGTQTGPTTSARGLALAGQYANGVGQGGQAPTYGGLSQQPMPRQGGTTQTANPLAQQALQQYMGSAASRARPGTGRIM